MSRLLSASVIRARRHAFGVTLAVMLGFVIVVPGAGAVPPPPHASTSYYIVPLGGIDSAFLRTMKTEGRNLGTAVSNGVYPHHRVTVIMDFGYMESRNAAGTTTGCYDSPPAATCRWGANLAYNAPWVPLAKVRSVVQSFATGFYYTTVAHPEAVLTIVMGVSNGGHETVAAGKAWANAGVDPANAWLRSHGPSSFRFSRQVHIQGGCDCETGYRGPLATQHWIDGYKQNAGGGSFLVDYGDCGGCPYGVRGTEVQPDNAFLKGWTVRLVWQRIKKGWDSRPQPQIYNELGNQAREWELIDDWGSRTFPGQRLNFRGSLSQHTAVAQGCGEGSGTNNAPDTGWSQLWRALNETGYAVPNYTPPAAIHQSLRYSTDIKWFPSC